MCEKPAEILDTEYEEAYCARCARTYRVQDGPWRWLEEDE